MAAKSTFAVNFVKYFVRLFAYSLYISCWCASEILDYIIHTLLVGKFRTTNENVRIGLRINIHITNIMAAKSTFAVNFVKYFVRLYAYSLYIS